MWPTPQENADFATFTEEILNGKLHFLCSVDKVSNINPNKTTTQISGLSLKEMLKGHGR